MEASTVRGGCKQFILAEGIIFDWMHGVARGSYAYYLMLRTIFFRPIFSTWNVLLQGRIHYELFTNGVTGQLPGELVLPADFGVIILGVENVVVVLFKLTMVMFDGVRDEGGGRPGSGEGTNTGDG